jgi:hypothetical protein
MQLCPNEHENASGLGLCRICQLPIVDLAEEAEFLAIRLTKRAGLGQLKASTIAIGVGTVGKRMVFGLKTLKELQRPGIALAAVDAEDAPVVTPGESKPAHYLQLTGSALGGSTFCGFGEAAAREAAELLPALQTAGLREHDELQTVIIVAALGGGTGSGAAPVVLERCREINPAARVFVVAIMPGPDEPIHAHFNACYGLSQFLREEPHAAPDMIVLVQNDRLQKLKGLGAQGTEVSGDQCLIEMLRLLVSVGSFPTSVRIARLNNATQARLATPCIALGRSMEIFENLSNVVSSAILFPLVESDNTEARVCHLLFSVSRGRVEAFPTQKASEALNHAMAKFRIGATATLVQMGEKDDRSDRVDACVFLGREHLGGALAGSRRRYDEFVALVKSDKAWSAYGLTATQAKECEERLRRYEGAAPKPEVVLPSEQHTSSRSRVRRAN